MAAATSPPSGATSSSCATTCGRANLATFREAMFTITWRIRPTDIAPALLRATSRTRATPSRETRRCAGNARGRCLQRLIPEVKSRCGRTLLPLTVTRMRRACTTTRIQKNTQGLHRLHRTSPDEHEDQLSPWDATRPRPRSLTRSGPGC